MNPRLLISRTPEGALERKIALALAAILFERLWGAAFNALMLFGLALLLIASGLLAYLPEWPRAMILLALFAAIVFSLRPLSRLRVPTRDEALRRIEAASSLPHQPLRALADTPLSGRGDARAQRLWRAHLQRLRARIANLRAGPPRSALPRRDPYALRFALALALLATFALQGGHFRQNLRAALRPPVLGSPAGPQHRLNAWLDPPAFLRKPPLVLASQGRVLHAGETLEVAQGTRLMMFAGGRKPRLRVRYEGESKAREERFVRADAGAWKLRLPLRRSATVTIPGQGVSWHLRVIPDAPPTVALTSPPRATAGGGLLLRWRARDDHGVRAVRALITLARPVPNMLSFKAPDVALRLSGHGREVTGREILNLAAHPWAGMTVKLRLRAQDVAGQTALSPVYELTLPQRPFSRLLAQAIVEQRRALVLHPERAKEVAEMLAAFLAWPVGVIRKPGVYLGLRLAMSRLLAAREEKELKSVVALLWEIATDVEDGDLSAVKKRLRAARKALEEALRNGASEEEIARRVAALKRALDSYLRKLAKRGARADARLSMRGDARIVSERQLRRMMDRLADLARSGARDAARRLLSQLDDILQNLQTMPRMAAPPGPQQRALSELRRMMRDQQKLMDETWKRSFAPRPGAPEKETRPRSSRERDMRDLQMRQRALSERLRRLLDKLGREGGKASASLGKARRSMKGAARALGKGLGGRALSRQRDAMRALREGAGRLARQIARQRGGAGGLVGMGAPRYDPLGRPLPGRYAEPDRSLLPDENATQRARRILEYLRRKAAEATQAPLEHDYLERLLRDLY